MLEAMAQGAARPASMPPPHHRSAFRELLSELNPLQYLPVVGTIYRAVTGDTIPETARTIGGLVVSGLTGGPLGIALSVAALAVEKATGIDPERVGHALLADVGIGTPTMADAPAPLAAPAADVAVGDPGVPAAQSAPVAWSAAQLRSYGVVAAADGTLTRSSTTGTISGADVLNDLELAGLADTVTPGMAGVAAA